MRLRSHLIGLVLVAVLPVLAFACGVVTLLAREQLATVELGLRGTSRALSAAVDERIASVVTGLNLLAASEDFDTETLAEFHRRAARAVSGQEGWQALSLTRVNGEQLLTTQRPFGTPLPSLASSDSFQQVVATGQPAVSGFTLGKTSGVPIIVVSVPVRRNGTLAYVLSGSLRLEVLSRVLEGHNIPSGWTSALLDRNATILARSHAAEQFVGRAATPLLAARSRERLEDVFEDVTQEGRPAYGAFSRSKVTGWTVVLGLPASELRGPVHRTFGAVLGGGAALLLVAIVLAIVFGRRIARPMLALSSSAAALGRGTVLPAVVSQVTEVADIARALETAARERDRSEATLRETNETFDALIQASPVAILMLDRQGAVCLWNPAAEHVLGWSRDEVLGQRLGAIAQEGDAALEGLLLGAFEGEPLKASDWRQVNRRGEPVVLQVSTAALKTAGGEPRYVMAIIEDSTGRVHATERLAEERQTVDTLHHLGSALAGELELQRLLQLLTDEATALTGAQYGAYFHTAKDEQGGVFQLYTLSGAPREAFDRFGVPRSTRLFSVTFRGEGILRLDDVTQDARYGHNPPHRGMPQGHLPVRSYLAVPVTSRTGEVLGGLFFGHPRPGVFTERHERLMASVAAQAAVAIDNASLYQKAQHAIQLRDDFLSVASHELKTPLTPLRLQLHHLLKKVKASPSGVPAEAVVTTLERMMQQVSRLARLVDELLDVSRIVAGRLELHPEEVEFTAVVKELVAQLDPERERTGSTLTVQAEGPILGIWDRSRLEQLLTNLISNALKYGAGKPIDVTASVLDGWVTLTVRDQGIGIAPEDQARIFERFERAVSVRKYGGLGLGLWIAWRIVDAFGGRISVDSAVNAGACFTVKLPVRPP
ncbi:ATP-binding protein [Archangium sp.]|jgi:PAS domain S-box-containing protein|uniref:sensor histidine kinase n=1 Tax=Archangium sp. TaxID=1872627 RepID=UPI002EDA4492